MEADSVATPAAVEVAGHGMSFTVTDVIRSADETIAAGIMLNATPVAGSEYVLARFTDTCQEPSGETCLQRWVESRLVGDPGFRYYPTVGTASVTDGLIDVELGPKEAASALKPVVVEQGLMDLTLIHGPRFAAADLEIPGTRGT